MVSETKRTMDEITTWVARRKAWLEEHPRPDGPYDAVSCLRDLSCFLRDETEPPEDVDGCLCGAAPYACGPDGYCGECNLNAARTKKTDGQQGREMDS